MLPKWQGVSNVAWLAPPLLVYSCIWPISHVAMYAIVFFVGLGVAQSHGQNGKGKNNNTVFMPLAIYRQVHEGPYHKGQVYGSGGEVDRQI